MLNSYTGCFAENLEKLLDAKGFEKDEKIEDDIIKVADAIGE